MKHIVNIFRSDVRGLAKNMLALIIAIGLCFLPSLYAWFNIYSNWDPYSNTANIRVAAFSEDAGYVMEDGTIENMGAEVLEELKTNDKIGWTIAKSSEQALEGVRTGKYYAAVVIEQDFTYKMYNMLGEGFQNPGITYYENQKKNAVASKITDTAVSTLQQSIDSKFLEVVTGEVFKEANTVSGELKNSDKMDAFITKISGINENLKSYEITVGSLLAGNEELSAAISEANGKLEGLKGRLGNGVKDVDNIKDDLSGTKTSLAEFNQNVENSLNAIETSLNKISGDVADAKLAEKTRNVVKNMTKTATDISKLQKQLEELVAALTKMQDTEQNAELKKQIQKVLEILGTISGSAEEMQKTLEGLGILGTEITQSTGKQDNGQSSEAIQNAGNAGGDKAEGLVNNEMEKITAVLSSCASSIGNMKNLYTSSLVPEVNHVLDSTSQILGNVTELLHSLDQTIGNTRTIFDGIVSTINGTNQSLEQIQAVLQNVSGKLTQITNKLNSVSEDERVGALIQMMQGDPEAYGEFFSEPVQIDTKEVYPIANYGSAMSPFYTVLALWVGALILSALIKVKAEPRQAEGIKHYHLFFGRYLLFFVLGQIQAAIVVLGDIYLLKCQILDKGMFWLTASVASFVFTLLIYSLTLSFGDIGKAVAVVIMVIQIAGSGGTFPVELLPSVYRNIYIFFPFPYAINAMRETVGGMYGNMYVKSMCELLIFAAAALAIGLVIRIPFMKLNHFVEKRMEDTKMM